MNSTFQTGAFGATPTLNNFKQPIQASMYQPPPLAPAPAMQSGIKNFQLNPAHTASYTPIASQP